MSWLPDWLSSTVPSDGPIVVGVELVGREHAGKSVLLDQLAGQALEKNLPSGLRFSIDDPRELAERLRRRQNGERQLRRAGYTATVDERPMAISLTEAGRTQLVLKVRETQGQVLTCTPRRCSAEQQAHYYAYLKRLAGANVLWQFTPCPPSTATPAEVERFRDDVKLTTGFIRSALERRQADRPYALALLVNRIDVRYPTEEEARRRMPKELLGWLAKRARQVTELPCVGEACVIPVTALGFGTAVARLGPPRPDTQAYDEREWLLRPDARTRPFGLTTLLAWSALAGLRLRPLATLSQKALPRLQRLCRMLASDLESKGAWRLPLPVA